jgi:CheY-like chemotaxis protein
VLALFMKRLGYEAHEAASGLEAIDRAVMACPDLILMDFWLPGISGLQTARRLKLIPTTKDIPVLIITGYSIEKQRALDTGVAHFAEAHRHDNVPRFAAPPFVSKGETQAPATEEVSNHPMRLRI